MSRRSPVAKDALAHQAHAIAKTAIADASPHATANRVHALPSAIAQEHRIQVRRRASDARPGRFLLQGLNEAMAPETEMNRESLVRLTEMQARFLQFLRGRLGDRATAEDILQTAYVKAMQHGAVLRDAESTVAWFYRILRN